MTIGNARLAASLVCCAAVSSGWAARLEVRSSIEDVLRVATQSTTVGTNVHRADIEARPLRPGTAEAVIEKAAEVAFKACPADLELSIAAADRVDRDFVGDTNSRLSGLGLYVSVSERGLKGSGTGFIAPCVSLHLTVSSPALKQARELDIVGSERIEIARADTLEFVNENRAEVERAVIAFAARTVQQRLRKELAAVLCP
jgi:hypothetical protein